MTNIDIERLGGMDKAKVMITRFDPAADQPDYTSASVFKVIDTKFVDVIDVDSNEGINPEIPALRNYEYKFDITTHPEAKRIFEDMERECNVFKNLANLHRESQEQLCCKLHMEISYEIYIHLRREAHRLFNCNIKRALRRYGCRLRIRYLTRNGYWVWGR